MKKGFTKEFSELWNEAVDSENREVEYVDPVAHTLSSIHLPHFLDGKTVDIITNEISFSLTSCFVEEHCKKQWLEKLYGYIVVKKVEDLILGRYIRWITVDRDGQSKLTKGAFAVGIRDAKSEDGGKVIVCRNSMQHFLQCPFQEGRIFQQLSQDEMMVLILS
jgi:hypothetical protein